MNVFSLECHIYVNIIWCFRVFIVSQCYAEKQLNEFLKKGKIAIIEPSLARFTASSVKKQ